MRTTKKTFPEADKIIAKLKLYYQLKSDASLAALLGLRPNTLSIWKVRNSVDLQRIIEHCPSLDLNWLVDDKMTTLPARAIAIAQDDRIPDGLERYGAYRPINEGNQVYTVEKGILCEYAAHCQEKSFIKKLQGFRHPSCFGWEGITRMFQLESARMEPVIQANTWMIAMYMQKPWMAETGRLFIAVTAKDVYWGRLQDRVPDSQQIELFPDNKAYPVQSIKLKDLRELWAVQSFVSKSLDQQPKWSNPLFQNYKIS